MAKLWFGNRLGQERVIAECENFKEVNIAIDKFIAECNKKWPNKTPFKRYYTRIWNEGGRSVFDVGSHSEFFYFELPYPTDEHGFVDESEVFNR